MDCYIASLSLVLTAVITLCSAASIRYQDAPCHAEMLRKQKAYEESNLYMKYVPLPQCDEDGFYKSLQRKRSNFSCVTSHGFQVDYKEYYAKGPCERLKRCVRSNQIGGANDDDLVQCDEYGFFKQLQETKSWRVCTTVYGRILKWRNVSHESDCQTLSEENRDKKSSFKRTQCKFKKYLIYAPCRVERERMENEGNDADFPQCDEHGFYKSLQRMAKGFFCYTSNGIPINYKFEKYYNETTPKSRGVLGTEIQFRSTPAATAQITATERIETSLPKPDGPCAVAKKQLLQMQKMYALMGIKMADVSLPDCDRDGYYSPMQCHFEGCYCANRNGKLLEMLEGPHGEYCYSLREYQVSNAERPIN